MYCCLIVTQSSSNNWNHFRKISVKKWKSKTLGEIKGITSEKNELDLEITLGKSVVFDRMIVVAIIRYDTVATPFQESIDKLQQISSSAKNESATKINAILQEGLNFFGLDIAVVSKIEPKEDIYNVVYSITPDATLKPGTICSYEQSFLLPNNASQSAHVFLQCKRRSTRASGL